MEAIQRILNEQRRSGRKRRSGSRLAATKTSARAFCLEPLEPRLLLDATPFVYDAGQEAADLTLALADVAGVATIQVLDNQTDSVLASNPLSETSEVHLVGSDLDDVLTIDFEDEALNSVAITFDARGGNDSILIAGGTFDQVAYSALGADNGTVTLGSTSTTAVTWLATESLVDISNTETRLFVHQTGQAADIRLGDDGVIDGLSLIDSNDTEAFTPILFAEPTNVVEIQGSDTGDRFLLGELELGFAAALSIHGGAGADTLVGPAIHSVWKIDSADSGTLNGTVSFENIENLAGTGDIDDTFIFEEGGSLSGTVNGGDGGIDNLIIHSATDTVIVIPDSTGSATFAGRTINYTGLESPVDAEDPATTYINGTTQEDHIVLETDPLNPGNLQVRIQDASFLVNSAPVDHLSFAPPTELLALDLRDGDDVLTLTIGEISGLSRFVVSGGVGNDQILAPDTNNVWDVTGSDSGTLQAIEFVGFENVFGGTNTDTFVFNEDGRITGILDGGDGLNELQRHNASSLWTISGPDSGEITDLATSEIVVQFEGIATLTGDPETDDTFVLEIAGSISGSVDGGAGALDQLIIEGSTETVLVLPDPSGMANFDGRSVAYSDLEPVVDDTDPAAVSIRSTVLADDLLLSGNDALPGDRNAALLKSQNYKFLSGGSVTDTIAFSTTAELSIALREGDDVITLGRFNPGFSSVVSIDAGSGDDELAGANTFNSWRLDAADGGVINERFHFESVETVRGGTDRDIFSITNDGSLTGSLHGGSGNDDLRGPSVPVAWNVTANDAGEITNQLDGATVVEFFGIENLIGAEDTVDSFIISEGGSLSGSIEGGDGGWDSLVVRGTPDVVVVPGLLFGSVFFDTAMINGISVTYKGLEPFVDDSNAADVVINGTGVADDLTLAPDPDNAGMMRIAGSSEFLFYTNGTFNEGISFANPIIGLSINLRFGNDTLTISGFDPDFKVPVTISGGFGLDTVTFDADTFLPGQDLTVHAENIIVAENVTVSTREVGGSQSAADHLDGASTGNSGNITFEAVSTGGLLRTLSATLAPSLSEPTGITLKKGSLLLAHVDSAHLSDFDPGNVTLAARDENGLGFLGTVLTSGGALPLSGVFTNRSEVLFEEDTVLKGGNISVNAAARFSPHPDFLDEQIFDSLLPYKLQGTKLGELLGEIPVTVGTIVSAGSKPLSAYLVKKITGQESLPLQILGKIAESRIDVGANSEIMASGFVILEADATADATTKVDNPTFSVAFSLAHAKAEVLIQDGVQIHAGRDVNVISNAFATAKSEAKTTKNKTANPNAAGSLSAKTFSLAISESRTTASSTLSDGATIEAGGDVNILANGISTNEAGANFTIYLDGTFGVAAGIGFATSDITASVSGAIISDAGAVPPLTFGDINGEDDTIDFGVPHGFFTGEAVVYHEQVGRPIEALTDGTTYYVITEPGSTKIKLAEDFTSALQGKAIDLKAPLDPITAAGLTRATRGISVTATLNSSDKATAEAGIGDKPLTFVNKLIGKLAGSDTVKKITGKIPLKFLEKQRDKLESKGVQQSGAASKPSDYSIAGSIAFSRGHHQVTASAAGSASLKSRSDIQIGAFLTERVQTAAETTIEAEESANAHKKKSGSVALSIGVYNTGAHAMIGDGAIVDATERLRLESGILYPFLTEPRELYGKDDFTSVENIKKLLDGKLGLQDKLLNSWAVSSAHADELAISGSIDWLDFTNVSEAIIGEGAQINQDALYQSAAQAVSIQASTEMQMVHMSGVFDFDLDLGNLEDFYNSGDKLAGKLAELNPLGFGLEGKGKAFGGSLFVMLVENHTTAQISHNASVHTGSDPEAGLLLQAESKMFDLAMVQSGGSGGEFGAAGSFSVIRDDGTTWARIVSGAQIDGGSVTLKAEDNANHWNAVGGFMKGKAQGVGVSVAINLVSRDTAAFIGNEADQDPGAGTSLVSSGDIQIEAKGTGNVHTFSLAAAFESNKPMAGDPEDPLDGVSLPILFEEAEPEEEPAKTGLGIAGSVSWNTVRDQTRAFINDRGTISGDDIALTAYNDRGIVAASGAGAIVKTKGSESSTALAGSFSFNQLRIDTLAFITGASVATSSLPGDDSEEIRLQAERGGLLFSFSGGGSGAAAKNGTGGAGSVSVNRIIDTTKATLDRVTLTTSGDIVLAASEASQIIAIAGGGSYGETKGIGGAIAINQIASSTQAGISGSPDDPEDASNVHRSTIGSELQPIGALTLFAENDNSIQAVTLSLGISKGGGFAALLAINLLTNDPVSGTPNTVRAFLKSSDVYASGDVSLRATDDSTLEAVGGSLGIGGDKFGFGAALGWNQVNDTVSATIEDSLVTTDGLVHLTATATEGGPVFNAKIAAAAVGAAGSKQNAVGGALAINVIHDTIDAHISEGSQVTGSNDVILESADRSTLKSLTGGVAISTKATAVGAAISVNDISNNVTAFVDDAEVTSEAARVELGARSDARIGAIAVGGQGAEKFAAGGSVGVNLLRNTIDAHLTSTANVSAFGHLSVSALDNAQISSLTGGLSFSKSAIGAALSTNDIVDTTRAYTDNAEATSVAGDIDIQAQSAASILAITVGGGGASSFSLGGSISVNIVHNLTEAYVSGSSRVEAFGDLAIRATEQRTNDGSLNLGLGHGFTTGEAVVYDNGGGTDIGGLDSGLTYYVIVDALDPGTIRLAATEEDALAGIALDIDPSSATGSLHSLTASLGFDPAVAIDDATAENAIDLGPDHGLSTGNSVRYDNGGGVSIGGLIDGNTYFVIVDETNPNLVRLANSPTDALLGQHIDLDASAASGALHALLLGFSFNPARAASTTHVFGIAGGIAGAGKNAVGAALASNDIANQTRAFIDNSTVVSLNGDIDIEAASETKISALTVGGSGAGSFAAGGSVAVNLTLNTIDAHVINSFDAEPNDETVRGVHAEGAIRIHATDDSAVDGGSGGLSGASQTAIGAALMTNDIANDTMAFVEGSTLTAGTLDVGAASSARVRSLAIGGSGAGSFALGGSLAVNIVSNTIDGHISEESDLDITGNLLVSALDRTTIFAGAGGFALAGSTAIGAALASNDTGNTTTAYIEASDVTVSSGSILVTSDSAVDITSATVSGGGSGGLNLNGSIAVHVTRNTTTAYLGERAAVTADGNVIVSATDDISMLVGAGNLGGSSSAAVGISSSTVITDNTTKAYVADGATVSAGGNQGADSVLTGERGEPGTAVGGLRDGVTYFVIVDEDDPSRIQLAASAEDAEAGLAIDLDPAAASGTSHKIASLDPTEDLEAVFDPATSIDDGENWIDLGLSHGFSTGDAVVYSVPAGDRSTENIRGLSVTAVSFESIVTVAAGGQGAGSIGGAGSVTVQHLNETTQSYIGSGAHINSPNDGAGPEQSVNVLASDDTAIFSLAGAGAIGGSAGIGAGADVGVVTKLTEAWIADSAVVLASNDVTVRARSAEDIRSIAAAIGGGGSAGIGGAASVYVLDLTTTASIGTEESQDGAVVTAGDSVLVSAYDDTELDMIGGSITGAGAASIGAAAAVPVIHKSTKAFIGTNATVTGGAQGDGIDAYTGAFDVTFEPERFELGEVPSPLFFAPNGITLDVTGDGNPDLNDPSLSQSRIATPLKARFKGVAVTAINQDSIETVGASGGGAGTVAVNVGGAVQVITTETIAFVAAGAVVNSEGSDAGEAQSVLVAAGNDYSHTGMAIVPAGAGTVAVTPGVDVTLVNNTTEAFIADGAEVHARGNITILANAAEDILSLSAGVAASGVVSVGGAVSVIVLHDKTYAHIGDFTTGEVPGASAMASGSVTVSAVDDTDVDLIAGSLGVGIGAVGVGASVGVTAIHKDTKAFIGDNAVVSAKGNGAALDGIYDGSVDANGFSTLAEFHGLAVQATSREDLVSVAASGAGGFYAGVAGGVSSAVIDSDTSAFVGAGAHINEDATDANGEQRVSVVAVNGAKALGVTGGLGIGIGGIGGAVDIGVIRNDTSAFIAEGTTVYAAGNVDVQALSLKRVDTLAVAAAGGIVGVAGSVSVWTIGGAFDSTYSAEGNSEETLSGNSGSAYPNVQSFVDDMAGGKIAGNGFGSIVDGYSIPTFDPENAVDNDADTIELGPDHGLQQGDAVVYRSGGGDSVAGLEDGVTYYVIVDTDNPDRIRLAASRRDALTGVPIDLDASSATGSPHTLEPLVGGTTRNAGNRIGESSPKNEISNATASTESPQGTTAYLAHDAVISSGGDVWIHASELINYSGRTGSIAIGAGGIGGSVTIVNIESHTDAHIASGATVLAGGAQNAITVQANLVEHISGSAFAGQAGLIAAGAQVVVINDNSTQLAYIANGATVGSAGTVSVLAGAERTLIANAKGGGVGGSAIGAAIAFVNAHGNSSAIVDGATIGKAVEDPSSLVPTVDTLIVAAETAITAEAHTVAVAAGLGAGAANGSVAVTTVDPGVSAYVGDDADIQVSNDLLIHARLEAEVSAEALGISVDLGTVALGASVAFAYLLPEISAHIGTNSNVYAANDIFVRSGSNVDRDGKKLNKGVRATATSASGGLILGGGGAFATSENTPDVQSSIGEGSVISAGNDIALLSQANLLIPSRLIDDPLHAGAKIEIGGAQASGAGFGAAGVGVSVSKGHLGGTTASHVDGAAITAGRDFNAGSESFADASVKAWAVAGGAAGGAGNNTTVDVDSQIKTYIGVGSEVQATGDIHLISRSEGAVDAESRGVSVGGLSIAVSHVDAKLTPRIETYVAPAVSISAGGDVALLSMHNYGSDAPLDLGVHATGSASGGGVLSGNGANVEASSSAYVDTFVGDDTTISAGESILLTSHAHNAAEAEGSGKSIVVAGVGAILARADVASTTLVHTGNSAILTAGDDVVLVAKAIDEGTATAEAGGGGLVSGNGADARSAVSPTVRATTGDFVTMQAGQDMLIHAQAETHASANATGTAVGALSAGGSLADAETVPNVSAAVGDGAVLLAGHGITVTALYNIAEDGSGINTVKADSTGSSGSLLAGLLVGADAKTVANVHVSADIGAETQLDITDNAPDSFVTIASRAYNAAHSKASGNAGGLFAGDVGASGTSSTAIVTTHSGTTIGAGSSIGGGLNFQGNLTDVLISSTAMSVVSGSADGASGKDIAGALSDLFSGDISIPSILSGGGTAVDFDIDSAATTVIGESAHIEATGQVSVTSDSIVDVNGSSSMTSGGIQHADAAVLVDVFVDSDATVFTGNGSSIEGGSVLLGSHNQIDGSAVSLAEANVTLGVADAAATSRFNVGTGADPGRASVNLGQNSTITAHDALNIEALNDQESGNLLSKAKATSFGAALTGDAIAEANGTVQVQATVSSGDGAILSSGSLAVNADSTIGIDRTAESDAASQVTEFVREARTVVRKVTRWLPWPLNKIVAFVTETIFVLVPKVTAVGSESAKATGLGVQSADTVNLNGDIYSFGTQDALLVIHADPADPDNIIIDPASNISAELADVDGDGVKDISVGDLLNDSSADITITAVKGDIIGNARIHINKVIENVHIVNETEKNLVLHHLDTVSTNDSDPDLNFQSENGQEYEVDSALSSSTINIENLGSGDVIFAESFSDPTASLDVYNLGGSIRLADSSVYLETGDVGHLNLKTDGGDIGEIDVPFTLRLLRGKILPDGTTSTLPAELTAEALGNIYLDVTGVNNTFTEFNPDETVDGIVLNLNATVGDIAVMARRGVIIDKITEESTNENGDPVTTETDASREADAVYSLKRVTAVTGNITVNVEGSLDAGVISAPDGLLTITAERFIRHANNVFVGEPDGPNAGGAAVVLTAGFTIGDPSSPLLTQAGKLEATAPEGIWILNSGPLVLGGISEGKALSSDGPIVVGATSPVTVVSDVTSLSDIVLTAGDSPLDGDDLVITNGATVATPGSVTLIAGDTFRLDAGSSVIAGGALDIIVDPGNADSAGGSLEIKGTLQGNPINLGGGSGNDIIAIASVLPGMPLFIQTGEGDDLILVGSNATGTSNSGGTPETIQAALNIDGGPGFDELRIDDSAATANVVETVTGNVITGFGLKAPVTYENVDSVVIDVGSGNDFITVGNAAARITLNLHGGADRVDVGPMVRGLIVNFGSGDDVLTVSDETMGDIVAHGGDGDDDLQGAYGNDQLFGDAGNDVLHGGDGNDILGGGDGDDDLWGESGDDILLGGSGSDRLSAGRGRDILIGGLGADWLFGGQDGDIFVGGTTIYDDDLDALSAIRAEWTRTDVDVAARINHLSFGGGLNGSRVLNSSTVVDDGAHDRFPRNHFADWSFEGETGKPITKTLSLEPTGPVAKDKGKSGVVAAGKGGSKK